MCESNLELEAIGLITNHGLMPSLQTIYLMILNKKHEKKRESVGKVAKVVDRSMIAVRPGDSDDVAAVKDSQGQIQDNSLNDLTDWQNEDFVYVY